MIANSIIISLAARVWSTVLLAYNTSLLCRFISKVRRFFGGLWAESGLNRFFSKYSDSPGYGFIGRTVAKVEAYNSTPPPIGGFWAGSFLLSYIKGGLDNLFRAFWALCEKSLIAGFVAGFFGEGRDWRIERPEKRFYIKYAPLYALAVIAFLGLYAMLDFSMFIMTAGALFGGVLILYKTEIGVLLTAFLTPLAPTKIILGLCAVTVLSYFVKALITRTLPVKFGITDVFAALFTIVLAYGAVISYHRPSAFIVSATYALFIAFYFAAKNTLRSRKLIFIAVSLLAAAGLLVSLYGVYQQVTGNFNETAAWIDEAMFEEATNRIYSTLSNPNILGEYLLFVVPLAFAAVYYFKRPVYKTAALGILGISALCMIFTQSRGAWLGLLIGFALFVMVFDRRLILVGVIALLLMPIALPDSVLARFQSIGNLSDSSTAYRVYIWQACLNMLKDVWLSGIGSSGPSAESFRIVYQRYAFSAVYAPHSHNLFLQIIIDYGIFGILTFFGLICAFFRCMLASLRKTGDIFRKAVAAALCAGMLGYLAQGMTENVWYSYRIVAYFWFILALGGALASLREGKDA